MQISGETARYELTHLNLHCLQKAQYCLWRWKSKTHFKLKYTEAKKLKHSHHTIPGIQVAICLIRKTRFNLWYKMNSDKFKKFLKKW